MADLRSIIGGALAAAATGDPFSWQRNEMQQMMNRIQMENATEQLKLQREHHDMEKKKIDIALKEAEREGQGFFERLGLIPPSNQPMTGIEGDVAPMAGTAPQPNIQDIVRAIFSKGTGKDVKDIGIPLLAAMTKDTKPVTVGGKGVYIPGQGFEQAPWGEETPDNAVAPLREFEMVTGISTASRGTPEYQKAYENFLRQKKQAIHIETGPSAASNRHVSTGLRKEFNSLGPVKEYREVENKFQVMDKAYEESKKSGNFVAIDQALITLYNKMTDPNSVVRESEFVRTPEDMAVMNRIKAGMSRIGKGGRLEPDTRQALMTMATKFREVYSGKFNDLAQEWREYAIGYGVDPNLVVSSKTLERVKESGTPKTVNYKVGDLYEGKKKILGINRQTRQLNIDGLGVVSY
jgi:hypothetical protein